MSRTSLIGLLVLVAASPSFAQNLLVNPGFDVPDQITGWTCSSVWGTASWSPVDRLGSPGSGSMQHDVSASSDNRTVECWQCVPVTENYNYVLSAWYYWPDDPDVSQIGTTRLTIQFFSDAGCTNSLPGFEVEVGHPILDTWLLVQTEAATAPPDSMAAVVYLFTWQNFADQPVRAQLDDIEFVEVIFLDGFESGDLSAWSVSVP